MLAKDQNVRGAGSGQVGSLRPSGRIGGHRDVDFMAGYPGNSWGWLGGDSDLGNTRKGRSRDPGDESGERRAGVNGKSLNRFCLRQCGDKERGGLLRPTVLLGGRRGLESKGKYSGCGKKKKKKKKRKRKMKVSASLGASDSSSVSPCRWSRFGSDPGCRIWRANGEKNAASSP